jgi:hypothetical protein
MQIVSEILKVRCTAEDVSADANRESLTAEDENAEDVYAEKVYDTLMGLGEEGRLSSV